MHSGFLQKNFFELLGLTVTFDIDKKQLESNYLRLQNSFHPDRYSRASAQEKRMVVQLSARLNQARSCLLDEVQRARYMLQLQGVEIADEQTIDDMDFLIQQMEWRETAQNLAAAADKESKQLQDFQEQMAVINKEYVAGFVHSYAANDWQDAKLFLAKMQFMQKLKSTL